MAGRHAAGGMGDFIRGLTLYILKWFLFGAIVFLVVWAVIVKVPDWFPSEEAAIASTSTVVATSVPTASTRATPATTAPAKTTTTSAVVTTTVPSTTTAPTTTQAPAAPTTTVAPAGLNPSEISVRVLNSTPRGGLAATVTANLLDLGYLMLEQGNYSPTLTTTTIFYIPGYADVAGDLAAELPGAVSVEENPAGTPSADLLVVLGSSYP